MLKFDLKKIKYFKKNSRTEKPRAVLGIFFGLAVMLAGAGYIGAKNGWFGGVPERTAILLLLAIGVGLMLIVAISKRKSFSFGTAPKNPNRIAKLAIIAVIIFTLGVGGTFALNGFFGGGEAVPEDTFSRGLVGYWSFDEGKGNIAYDASGNGNNGTLTNGPKWTNGRNGGAMDFDGKDDYVDAGNNVIFDMVNSVSVEAWVRRDENPGLRAWVGIAHKWPLSYILHIHGDKAEFRIKHPTLANEITASGTTTIQKNQWYHLVGIYDGAYVRIYVNGVLETSVAYSEGIRISTIPIQIGKDQTSTDYFDGNIDDVRIYNRALSAAEVKYHYNHGGPVGYWKFDEGNGIIAKDSSGNNNGIISGANWVEGKYGSALIFDGVDDYFLTNNQKTANNYMTMSAWVKRAGNGSGTFPGIISYGYGNVSGNPRMLLFTSSNKLGIFVQGNGGNGTNNFSNYTLPLNEWVYVTAIYDGSSQYIYVNGRIESFFNQSVGNLSGTNYVQVGMNGSAFTTNSFNGLIDDVRVYDYARTADEIRLDYQAGIAAFLGPSGKTCSEDPASCMDKGLAGYWDMDEGKGTIANDKSGNGNTCALTNGLRWVNGKTGGAFQFDGKDDNADCGINPITNITDAISIEAWMKITTNANGTLVGRGLTGAGDHTYALGHNNGKATFQVANGYSFGSGDVLNSLTDISDGKWHHVLGTFDGANLLIYIDGKYDNGKAKITKPTSNSNLKITLGKLSGYSYYYKGLSDEIRLYNRALSAEEARYHYNQGAPVGWWKCDEGSGVKVADFSGNNNDGVISGASWAEGKYGSALNFDGNDSVDISNCTSLNPTTAMTISGWVKSVSAGTGMILAKNNQSQYRVWKESDDKIYSNVTIGGTVKTVSSQSLLGINWHHFAVLYDGASLKLYFDGRLENSVLASGNIAVTSNNLKLGVQGTSYYLTGLVDDVKIYDYARTAGQVLQDYQSGISMYFGPSGKTCAEDPASCMDKGLVGYWDMEEGKGSFINDGSGNNNNGILTNGPAWTTGKNGSAISLDGKNDWVNCGAGTSLNLVNKSFTLEAWTRRGASGGYHQIIGQGTTSKDTGLYFFYRSDNRFWFTFWGETSLLSAGTYPDSNQWHHWVGTYDANTNIIKLYRDGLLENSGIMDGDYVGTGNLSIGATGGAGGGYLFKGQIDDVRIYDRVLSSEEVKYHYNQGAPAAYWDMDEGTGSLVNDQSGNRNRGAITGATWAQGKFGSALRFDGASYVDCGTNSNLDITNQVTLSAWVNLASYGSSTARTVVSKWRSVAGGRQYMLSIYPGKVYFSVRRSDDSAYVTLIGDKVLQLNNWHYITAVYNGNTQTMETYVDGMKDKTMTSGVPAAIASTTSKCIIGAYNNGASERYDGLIDELKIYNYARTADQIKMDYQQGLATHLK